MKFSTFLFFFLYLSSKQENEINCKQFECLLTFVQQLNAISSSTLPAAICYDYGPERAGTTPNKFLCELRIKNVLK